MLVCIRKCSSSSHIPLLSFRYRVIRLLLLPYPSDSKPTLIPQSSLMEETSEMAEHSSVNSTLDSNCWYSGQEAVLGPL